MHAVVKQQKINTPTYSQVQHITNLTFFSSLFNLSETLFLDLLCLSFTLNRFSSAWTVWESAILIVTGWTVGKGLGLTFVGADTNCGAETVSALGPDTVSIFGAETVSAIGTETVSAVGTETISIFGAETIPEGGTGFAAEFDFLLTDFGLVTVSGVVASLDGSKGLGTPFLISSLQKRKKYNHPY